MRSPEALLSRWPYALEAYYCQRRLLCTHLAIGDDDVDWVLLFTRKISLDDILRAVGIPLLCVERGPADYKSVELGVELTVRDHAVATAQWVAHRAPWVVFGRGLHIYRQQRHTQKLTPDVSSVAQ